MSRNLMNSRVPAVEVDSLFLDRWSPRSFRKTPIPDHQIRSLFEAARWAPSCYNEQPWSFVYARTSQARQRLASVLVEKNRKWADRAPLLMFVLARRRFKKTGKENRHAPFDAGAAWMSLAIQARRLGLYAHAMAGFDLDRAYEVLGVSKKTHHVLAAIAVGRRGETERLPEEFRAMESPNGRKDPSEVAIELR